MNFKILKSGALLTTIIAPVIFSIETLAQEESASTSRIEEVVVTARKRQESIQDVAVSVSALTPGQIERSSVARSIDIAKLVPNVELHETFIGSESLSASIRGIGYDDIEKSIETTVGVSIDGVFLASNSGAVFDMFDVEAVEVLRGPQGTLFGRNTIGGVINVRRTEPTGEWGAKIEASVGDEKMTDLKAIVNIPLGDRGGIKLSVKDLQSDSHVYNTTIKDRRDFRDSQTASIAIKYNFTDNTSAVLTFDDYDHQTTAPDNVMVQPFGMGSIASEAVDWKTSPQLNPLTAYLEGDNITLKVTHNSDDYQFKYIMGIMDYEEEVHESSWGMNGVFFPVDRDQTFKQTSHELNLTSDFDGPVNFVAGLYYLEADSYITSGPVQNFTADHSLEATAVFGEVSYDFSDVWSMTVGARYTEEDKYLDSRSWNFFDVPNRVADNRAAAINEGQPTFSDNNTSFRVVLQRDFEKGMMYASVSTGFRSGGFFNRGSTPSELLPYGSEEVTSYELGIRSNPTDNSQINLTFFSADYDDMQLTVIVPGDDPLCGKGTRDNGVTCSFVRNAGKVTMDGIEFEGVLMPTDSLTLRAAIGTFDGGYDKFDYDGVDIANKSELLYAPELTASFVAEHTSDLAGGELTITGGMTYKDDVFTQTPWALYDAATYPKITIDSYETIDLSATFIRDMGNGTLKLRIYGTDILESGNRVGRRFTTGSFTWAELVPRRQFGLTLGYEF